MYEYIYFYLGKDTIVINDQQFPLGKLTAEILNLSPSDYQEMKRILLQAGEQVDAYIKTSEMVCWRKANEHLRELDRMLCEYLPMRILKQQPCILEMTELLLNTLMDEYEEFNDLYPEEQERVKQEIEHFWPEDTFLCWMLYEHAFHTYASALDDIAAFNQAMRYFIDQFISYLIKLDPENYAAALHTYLFNSWATDKIIPNPTNSSLLFTNSDQVILRFIPQQISPDVEEYQIFEYYEVPALQTFFKMDFYRGLSVGHVIRRCEYCKRYFMMTRGYHTRYCDRPNPENPKYTCAQLGYRRTGLKEEAKNDPLKRSLYRCYQRLSKDVSRGNLTDEERVELYAMAEELHFNARRDPNISFEEFDKMLATKNLCKLCGIERKAGKRRDK